MIDTPWKRILLVLTLIFCVVAATTQINWVTQVKNGPYFDARSYGAKCDGSTNDQTAIQAAITAAQIAGGTVWIPSGTCVVSSAVVFSSSNYAVTLAGNGPQSILSTNSTILNTVEIRGTQPVYIHDLQFTTSVTKTAGAFVANYGLTNRNSISSLTCSSGSVNLTAGSAFPAIPSSGSLISLSGVSPGGFNGTYPTSTVSGSTATFNLYTPAGVAASCPASSGSGGVVYSDVSTNAGIHLNNYSQIRNVTFNGGGGGWIGIDWEGGGAYWWMNTNQFTGTFAAEAILLNAIINTDNAGGNIQNNQINITGDAMIRANSGGGLVISGNALIGVYNYGIDLYAIGGVQFPGGAGGTGGVGQILISSDWIVAWSATGYGIRMSQSGLQPTLVGYVWVQDCYLDRLATDENEPAIYVNLPTAAQQMGQITIQNNTVRAPMTFAAGGLNLNDLTVTGNTMLMNLGSTQPAINITATGNNVQQMLVSNNHIQTSISQPSYSYSGNNLVTFIDDRGDPSGVGTQFLKLPAGASNSSRIWCTDCSIGTSNACAGSGSGEFAHRIGGAWKCYDY